MGKINMKLMQGIEEAEGQIKKEKETQVSPASESVAAQKPVEKSLSGEEKAPRSSRRPKAESGTEKQKKEKGKEEKQVFSFRASLSEIAVWKAFATATGEKMENIGCMAMSEYVKRHKLSGTELTIFEAIKSRSDKQ